MNSYLPLIRDYAQRMGLHILHEEESDEILVVQDDTRGVCNLVLDCEDPILVMEQVIMEVKIPSMELYQRLLQLNRRWLHGAFVLDEEAKRVIFRDTLQIENLDFNEFEGSINALSLGLAEFSQELLQLNR